MSFAREGTASKKIREIIRESPAAALLAGAILGPPLGLSPPPEEPTQEQ